MSNNNDNSDDDDNDKNNDDDDDDDDDIFVKLTIKTVAIKSLFYNIIFGFICSLMMPMVFE